MKKFYNYTFQLVCIYILVLSFFSISNFEIKIDHYDRKVYNVNQEKILGSWGIFSTQILTIRL